MEQVSLKLTSNISFFSSVAQSLNRIPKCWKENQSKVELKSNQCAGLRHRNMRYDATRRTRRQTLKIGSRTR